MNLETEINEPKKKGFGIKLIAAFIVTIILSVLVGAGGLLVFFHLNPDYVSKKVTNISKLEKEVTVNENGIADAVDKVYDSIVVVETFQKSKLYATGSGVIYKNSNNTYYVITNYHVISAGTNIKIVLSNKKELDVKVVGGDKYADNYCFFINTWGNNNGKGTDTRQVNDLTRSIRIGSSICNDYTN